MSTIDVAVYADAAKRCRALADDLRKADKPVHDAVKGDCAGMAGDAPGSKQWGQAYDQAAQQTMQACSSLANALTNYAGILDATAYNYAVANKNNPLPARPDVSGVGQYQVSIPTSVRDNGIGFDHGGGVGGAVKAFFDKIVAKVLAMFGKLPNGDKDKLDKAHTTWSAFAKDSTVTGAAARIDTISGLFHDQDTEANRAAIQATFTTLKTSADAVTAAAQKMAPTVGEYHAASVDLSHTTTNSINSLEWALGITALLGIGLFVFSFGGSGEAAAVAGEAEVGEAVAAIQSGYRASQMPKILGMAELAAGAVGVVAAFAWAHEGGLDGIITKLAAIIAMTASIDEADEFKNLPLAPNNPAPGMTDEVEKYIRGKHIKGGSEYNPSKGTWPDTITSEELDELAEAAANSPARGPNKDGNFEREVDAGEDNIVGSVSEKLGGYATSRYKIVTDRFGGIITMYPIP
ncbi:hypothetical protein [Nocardia sp. NPDC050175]|uniref:hypothetical protein n=1 Tax=Nocardia sp. NPDC050175 TaxID=3364317 RepID=UPI0037B35417